MLARTAIGAARPTRACRCGSPPRPPARGCRSRRATCEWLAAFCPPLPTPVAAAARAALVTAARLRRRPGADLGDLRPVRPDRRAGCRSGPGCAACRSTTRCTGSRSTGTWCRRPPRRPRYTREVARPDLLLLGAFLHDIGKGLPGDHSVVGAPIAADDRRPDRPAAGRRGADREAGPAAPAAARRGHPARPRRPGDHRHGRRGGRRHGHARPAARAGPRRRAGHRPGRLVGLEGPADRRAGPPGAHRAGHRRAARAAGRPTRRWSAGPLPAVHLDGDRVAVAARRPARACSPRSPAA